MGARRQRPPIAIAEDVRGVRLRIDGGRGLLPGALCLVLACMLAGCGFGAGTRPTGVSLEVTREFGSDPMISTSRPNVGGAETAMSLLTRNAKVSTRYGGGYVSSIDGHAEGESEGHDVDWFYYINGLEAKKGGADIEVQEGDHIWWDLHDWSQTDHIPAIVGAFPEPFLDGLEGKKFPVKVGCADPGHGPCATVTKRLTKLQVPSAFATIGPTLEAKETLAVLVGTWSQLKASPSAHLLEEGPSKSGVYARVLPGGKTFVLLNADGEPKQTLQAGAGMIAATEYPNEGPTWIITGTDEAGLQRAAADFDTTSLDGHFAIAVTAAGTAVPLPEGTG